jgi:hypothetical protein
MQETNHIHVCLDSGVEHLGNECAEHHVDERTYEERRPLGNEGKYQSVDEKRHERSFGVMGVCAVQKN